MSSVYDTAGRMWREPPRCRVHGLTSDAGRSLNGLCGRIISPGGADGDADTRVMVTLQGLREKKSIKLGNLDVIPGGHMTIGVGVGREELNGHGTDPTQPSELWFNVMNNASGQRLAVEDLPAAANASCGRTMGNVMAVVHMLAAVEARFPEPTLHQAPPMLFMLTDLNVTCCVNNVALDASPPRAPHDLLSVPMAELCRLVRLMVDAGVGVYASFVPHRCTPDEHEDLGTERVNSVLERSAVLYPSPHPQKVGCVEVRFVGTPADPTAAHLTSRQERFIDYGAEEAISYAQFAASLGFASRLAPRTLASVDPQAFWAAYLRIHAFVAALRDIDAPADVVAEWEPLIEGAVEGLKVCTRIFSSFKAWGADGSWAAHLTSADTHLKIAQDGAMCGWFVSLDRVDPPGRFKLCFHVLDDYQGTEIGNLFQALMSKDNGADLNASLEALGYGKDPLGFADDPLRSCGGCGKVAKGMRKCSRCEGQVYCSSEC